MKKFVNKFELPKTAYLVKIDSKKIITVRTKEALNYWLTNHPKAQLLS
jgi:hypothetical protein